MLPRFADVSCACLPAEYLAALAELRASPGILTLQHGDKIWVRWEGSDDAVLQRLLPIPGVVLFDWREGRWYRFGSALPAFEVPQHGILSAAA